MNIRIVNYLHRLIGILILLAPISQAFAITNVTTEAVFRDLGVFNCCFSVNSDDHSTSSFMAQFGGQADASGYADYGVLKVKASADSGSTLSVGGSGTATASFSDSVLIDSSTLNGTSGTAIIDLKLNYGGAATGSQASASYQFTMRTITPFNTNFTLTNEIDCSLSICNESTLVNQGVVHTNQNDPYSIAVAFVYGQPISFELSAQAFAFASNNRFIDGYSNAIMDSSHSFYWGGISQILDENSNVVTAFNVTSDSGTNYLQDFSVPAVPEPETYVMFLAGLGLIGFKGRHRKLS